MNDVAQAWSRIENWLRRHRCAADLDALCPPVSQEALRSLEDAVPYPLHPQLVQWLGIHDGALRECSVWPFRFSLIRAEEMEDGPQWFGEMFEEFRSAFTDDGLEPEGPEGPWDPPNAYEFWVPVAVTNTGEYLAVDHRPGGPPCRLSPPSRCRRARTPVSKTLLPGGDFSRLVLSPRRWDGRDTRSVNGVTRADGAT